MIDQLFLDGNFLMFSVRFKKFPLLRYHMVVHTLPRKYKCQYCNSRFRTERHYTSHQKNHVDYYCETCKKKFNSAFALKVHRRMHVGASVKMYGCEECDHFFVDVSTFYNHMRRRHGNIPYRKSFEHVKNSPKFRFKPQFFLI